MSSCSVLSFDVIRCRVSSESVGIVTPGSEEPFCVGATPRWRHGGEERKQKSQR